MEQFQPIDIKTNGMGWKTYPVLCDLLPVHTSLCRYSARKEKRCGAGQGYSHGSMDEEWLYEVKAPASDNLAGIVHDGSGRTGIYLYSCISGS